MRHGGPAVGHLGPGLPANPGQHVRNGLIHLASPMPPRAADAPARPWRRPHRSPAPPSSHPLPRRGCGQLRSRPPRCSAAPCRGRHPARLPATPTAHGRSPPHHPPRMALSGALSSPACSASTVRSAMRPSASTTTWFGPAKVSSSRPMPCTSQASVVPSACNVSAIGRSHVGSNTPVSWRVTRAGLARGPSRLKMVRVPSSTRGPAA